MNPKVRPNRIKEWISKRSLNQSEVARQLGISTSYLSLITNGKRNPNLRLSTKLANLLDADILDLFPQFAETEVPTEVMDLVFCYTGRSDLENLIEPLTSNGLRFVVAKGDFEAGYYVAMNRPLVLLIDAESIGRSLNSLVQSLKSEPTTSHTHVIPLVNSTTGKRRRRQIDKMGLQVFEWGPMSADQIVQRVKEIIDRTKSQASA